MNALDEIKPRLFYMPLRDLFKLQQEVGKAIEQKINEE